jgi:UDP-N-acetylglucosamine transferase subunit ALG13
MRLFVTVGTQFPFDRLVRSVDEWLARHPGVAAFGQIGPSMYRPRHMRSEAFIDAEECRRRVKAATVVIAHAGMGSIITALELGKPIIVMPRSAGLDEHRNDHQLATARNMLAQGRVIVAFDEAHLTEKLNQLDSLSASREISTEASPRLLSALRHFIVTGQPLAPAEFSERPAPEVEFDDELQGIPSPVLAGR